MLFVTSREGSDKLPKVSFRRPAREKTQPAERLNLNARSLCDDVSPGMTKDGVSKWLKIATFGWGIKNEKAAVGSSRSKVP